MNIENYPSHGVHSLMHQIKQDFVADYRGKLVPKSTIQGWLIKMADWACKKFDLPHKWQPLQALDGNMRIREAVKRALPSLPQTNQLKKLEDELQWDTPQLQAAAKWLHKRIFPGEDIPQQIDDVRQDKRGLAAKELAFLFNEKLQSFSGNSTESAALLALRNLINIDETLIAQDGISPEALKRLLIGCYDGLDYIQAEEKTILRLFKTMNRNPRYSSWDLKPDSALINESITPYSLQCLLTHLNNPFYNHRGGLLFRKWGLKDEHAAAFASFLRHCSSNLKNLVFSHNDMGDAGIQAMAQSIKDNRLCLHSVEMAMMPKLGSQGAASLADICKLGLIHYLEIKDCPIGSGGCTSLVNALQASKCQLKSLILPQTTVDAQFCHSLEQALKKNKSLYSLELNLTDSQHLQDLAKVLAVAKQPLEMVTIKINEKIEENELLDLIKNSKGKVSLKIELTDPGPAIALSWNFANNLIAFMSSCPGFHLELNRSIENVDNLQDRVSVSTNILDIAHFNRIPSDVNALLARDTVLTLSKQG